MKKNKVVLITGCSSGLGEELANFLAEKGFKVYAGTRKPKKFRKAIRIKLDVLINKDISDAINLIVNKEGKIDVLINNAGHDLNGSTEQFNDRDFIKILNTNTVGVFRLIREVLPTMKKRRSGRIVNITSMSAFVPVPNHSLYSASKSALEALGLSWGYESQKFGIYFTNVAPGDICAEFLKKQSNKPVREKFILLKWLFPMLTKQDVCEYIYKLILMDKPPSRVLLGMDAKFMYFLRRLLPISLWDKLIIFVLSK